MRRELLAILLFSVIAYSAIDQSYIQTVKVNGDSQIEKTMEVSIFANQLTPDALKKVSAVCGNQTAIVCSVDVQNKKVTITDQFSSGGYYTYTTDYGLPSITHTMVITKIPTDKFGSLLDKLFVLAGVYDSSQSGGSITPIDLRETKENQDNAKLLEQFRANITYTVNMPVGISEATAGNVSGSISGSSVTFDLVKVLAASKPMVVKGSELNIGYIVAILGIVVLVGLAISFFGSKPVRKRK